MTAFVHIDYPTEHQALVRAERAAQSVQEAVRALDGARAIASFLLAAIVAALLVVANQVIDTWTDGHLMAAWILMWAVAFAAIALLAGPAKRVGASMRGVLNRRAAVIREEEADRKLRDVAMTDARVMADIGRAMSASAARDLKANH